jgi:hypothetical protein
VQGTHEGLEAARARGQRIGRPPAMTEEQIRHARALLAQPENIELKRALVSGIASAEFAGIDAFSRKVVEWQEWPVPPTLIMAIARQTWDEVRHAALAIGLIESYGANIGDFPDTLAGGASPTRPANGPGSPVARRSAPCRRRFRDPVVSLSMTNVSFEVVARAFQDVEGRRAHRRRPDGALLRLNCR